MAYVSGMPSVKGNECFLCAAARGDEESLVVDRGTLAFTLMNRFPYTSGHLMTVPVRHAPDVLAMTADEGQQSSPPLTGDPRRHRRDAP